MAFFKSARKSFNKTKRNASKSFNKALRVASKSAGRTGKQFGKSLNKFDKSLEKKWGKFQSKRERRAARAAEKASRVYGFKTELKKGADITENTYSPQAYALTIAKLKATGKAIPSGPELTELVKKEAARRLSAVTFLLSGWLYSVNVFAKAIGKAASKSTIRNANRINRKFGYAEAALAGNSPFTYFQNTAASKFSSNPNPGQAIAEEGLQAAALQTTSRMREYVAKKQQQRTNAVFGKMLR